MSKVLVSACLLGRACRYDGTDENCPDLADALARQGMEAVAFCPEESGGLSTPRPAAHFVGGDGDDVADGNATVRTREGGDVTEQFLEGARAAVRAAADAGCRTAFLKERSPSCGCALVHTADGLTRGCGVTAALLRRAGVATVSVR
ncbi:MAG: 2-thiouracil desulfurase family protein [Planctomycetota bacterium]